jgi:DNA-binding cell septation regulator SpoVG
MAAAKKKLITKVELRLMKGNKSKVKAMGHMILGNELIRINCTVLEGDKGVFVGLPGNTGEDKEGNKKWYSHVYFIDKDARQEMSDTVLAEFAKLNGGSGVATDTATTPTDDGDDGCPF